MCEPKEPGYFAKEIGWHKGEHWYLSLFESAGEAKILGEASTHYTKAPKYNGVAERIYRFNPEAGFVYIMRDPVDRTISHYWHNVRFKGERRDILPAITKDPHYVDVSDYPLQIAPYLELFGRSNVFILTFEEMIADPLKQMEKILSWLGLDSELLAGTSKEARFATPRSVLRPRCIGALDKFRRSSLWNTIHHMFPKILRTMGKRLALEHIDRTSVRIEPVVHFLKPILLEKTRHLSDMFGRGFPEWTTLFSDHPHP